MLQLSELDLLSKDLGTLHQITRYIERFRVQCSLATAFLPVHIQVHKMNLLHLLENTFDRKHISSNSQS